MDPEAKTIPYATMLIITRAREMVKHCEHADRILAEVVKFIGDDVMLNEKEKQVVMNHAIETRESLQRSISLYGKVIRKWEVPQSLTKEPK